MLRFKGEKKSECLKKISAIYDDINVPRSSSVTFATVKIHGEGV